MMTPRERFSPMPGSDEAREQGCTCPKPTEDEIRGAKPARINEDCPIHGTAAIADDRAGEQGPIDTEGDIADSAADPELRRS
jgi:hypothetical protein